MYTCDRCGRGCKKVVEQEGDRTNDGKGTPMRPCRYCKTCDADGRRFRAQAARERARKAGKAPGPPEPAELPGARLGPPEEPPDDLFEDVPNEEETST